MLSFIEKKLSGSKGNDFGLGALLEGIRALKARHAAEQAKLRAEKEKLRDVAITGEEMDESAVLKCQARAEAMDAALNKARNDAAAHLQKQIPAIDARVAELQDKQRELLAQRDKARLKALVSFIHDSGAILRDPPRRGQGGILGIPGTQVLERAEVEAALETLLQSAGQGPPSKLDVQIAELNKELQRLTVLTRYPDVRGIDTLVNQKND